MNKFIKALSLILVLTGSVYLPSANAASTTGSTEMLINLAETDPVLVDRLNDLALNDPKLLNQLLKMAESDPVQLERLLDLSERNPNIFWKIATIYNAQSTTKIEPVEEEQQMSTFGIISDEDVIQN